MDQKLIDAQTMLAAIGLVLWITALLVSRIEPACDEEGCREVHAVHVRRDAAERRERSLAESHRMGFHLRPYEGCPICEERL